MGMGTGDGRAAIRNSISGERQLLTFRVQNASRLAFSCTPAEVTPAG